MAIVMTEADVECEQSQFEQHCNVPSWGLQAALIKWPLSSDWRGRGDAIHQAQEELPRESHLHSISDAAPVQLHVWLPARWSPAHSREFRPGKRLNFSSSLVSLR